MTGDLGGTTAPPDVAAPARCARCRLLEEALRRAVGALHDAHTGVAGIPGALDEIDRLLSTTD